jgi:hypothetical protein
MTTKLKLLGLLFAISTGLTANAAPAAPAFDPDPKPQATEQPAGKETEKDKKEAEREKKKAESDQKLNKGGNRVAILNFGAPRSWQGEIADTVGIEISAKAWADAVPLLEKDNVNVVVVRVNSGGGLTAEVEKFHAVFKNKYFPRFRTVAWIESAISAAAMSPYVISEIYFLPQGTYGGAVEFRGPGIASKGVALEMRLRQMEEASDYVKRNRLIARSMQVPIPLSATVDPTTGEVRWIEGDTGDIQVNAAGEILTFNAELATKVKFAAGIAATKEELADKMGIKEVVWAGEEATRLIDTNMRMNDRTNKKWQVVAREYEKYRGLAESAQDEQRAKFVGLAKRSLNDLRAMLTVNPNFLMMNGISDDWFRQQEEELRKLLRK